MRDSLKISRLMQGMALAGVITLSGCASGPKYGPSEIEQAAEQGGLPSLYLEIKDARDASRPNSTTYKNLQASLDDVTARLAAPHLQRIETLAWNNGRSPVPLSVLDELDAEVKQVQRWDQVQGDTLAGQAADLRTQTEKQITLLSTELETLGQTEMSRRYEVLTQLAALNGGAAGLELSQQADQELDATYHAGLEALANKQLSLARDLLYEVAFINPVYKDLVYQQQLVVTALFEQNFWQALVDGRPDEAYSLFHDFAETPAFATHRDKVSKDAGELAEYFDALGDKQMRDGQWLQSYQAFLKAGYIRGKLNMPSEPSTGLQRFMLEMENRYTASVKAGRQTRALAYLSVIRSLYPQHNLLTSQLRPTTEAVFDAAVVKVSVKPFAASGKNETYGRQLASKISRFLLDTVPNEVRIVEREQFDASKQGQSYFLIDGEVLKADVESLKQSRKETRRVVTGTKKGPNPAHKEWLELPRSERSATTEPPEIADVPIYEDVKIRSTDLQKRAVLSASFRVVEPGSAKVLFVETVSDKSTAEGTSMEGMVLGDFKLEPVVADLPSEGEMLEGLAESVSTTIGQMLADRLLALEAKYEAAARQLMAEGKPWSAVDQWAYAYVVSEPDTPSQAEMRQLMEETVLMLQAP